MPESPEVRLMAEELNFYLSDVYLRDIRVLSGNFLKIQLPLKFKGVRCHGKLLIFDFHDSEIKMYTRLGLTGKFIFESDSHCTLEFHLESPPEFPKIMFFSDMRRFGDVSFSIEDKSMLLAQCILGNTSSPSISQSIFYTRAKALQSRTSRDVVSVLMDQTSKTGVCSGIGNYLLSEILYHSGINPFRKFSTLNQEEIFRIHHEALRISKESYDHQGMDEFSVRKVEGTRETRGTGEVRGYRRFLHVYSREKTPQGETVVAEKGSHGRTVWWVPEKQR